MMESPILGLHVGAVSNLLEQHSALEPFKAVQVFLTQGSGSFTLDPAAPKIVTTYAKSKLIYSHAPFTVKLYNRSHRLFNPTIALFTKIATEYGPCGLSGLITHLSLPYSQEELNDSPEKINENGYYRDSVLEFLYKVLPVFERNGVKLLLENTAGNTKGTDHGDIAFLHSIVREASSSHIGLCFDTEHSYARGSVTIINQEYLTTLRNKIDVVHLNAVPAGVSFGSYKDQHSKTPLADCSVYSIEEYINFITFMDEKTPKAYIFERSNLSTSVQDYKSIMEGYEVRK